MNQSRLTHLFHRSWLIGLVCVLFSALLVLSQSENKVNLDNNTTEGDLETYTADSEISAGEFEVENLDNTGNFSAIRVGVKGGGAIFGWAEFDGDNREVELALSDPTLESGNVALGDPDDDGDAEVIWVGTRGVDFNNDGQFEEEENGAIIALADINGDNSLEIIVLDISRRLGRFHAAGFGINVSRKDALEVVWIGILHENGRSRAATLEGISDLDGDGDDEIILRDLRIQADSGFGGQAFDIDNDGDDDIVIQR